MNVLYDPWLPVRYPDGTTREVGLREALLNAHESPSASMRSRTAASTQKPAGDGRPMPVGPV